GCGLVVLAIYAAPGLAVGRGIFAIFVIVLTPLLGVWHRFVVRTMREEALRPRAVVLGDAALARKIGRALHGATVGGLEVVGIVTPVASAEEGVVGVYSEIRRIVTAHGIQRAIVADGRHDARLPIDDLLALRAAGLEIQEGVEAYESVTGK